MHTHIQYKSSNQFQNDINAVRDTIEYLTEGQWKVIAESLHSAMAGRTSIEQVMFYLSFAGVQGYPAHAMCRTFALAAYRNWLAGEGIKSTVDGFHRDADKVGA